MIDADAVEVSASLLRKEINARRVLVITLKDRIHYEEAIIADLMVSLDKLGSNC